MTATDIANNFRIRNAKDLINFVQSDDNRLYVFLGRTIEWPDEEQPPEAKNTLEEILNARRDLNGIREIGLTDIVLGLREINYKSGVVFDQYEDDVDLTDKNFYVLTDQLNVYKCISNNNGSVSTVRPSHTTSDIPLEIDGYKWRYMFSVTTSLLRKFIISDFFPFNNDPNVLAPTKPGTIDNIRVDSAGSGYPANATVVNNTEIPLFIQGDGNQNSSATVDISTSQGQIVSIDEITDRGANYPFAPESNIPIAFRQLNGNTLDQSAYGIATTNPSGEIASVQVIHRGSNYSDGSAEIVQSSVFAYAETNEEGEIINADVPAGREGENFTRAEIVVVSNVGSEASLKPIISPLEGHGSDPASELLANFALINLRLSGEEGFLGNSNFRRVGLIEDPKQYEALDSDGSPLDFTDKIGDARYTLTLSNGDNTLFTDGEQIVGQESGAVGVQTNLFETDKIRTDIDNSLSSDIKFVVDEDIVGVDSGAQTAISSISTPDIERYKGEILYINNREVVETQNEQQIETITLVLEF